MIARQIKQTIAFTCLILGLLMTNSCDETEDVAPNTNRSTANTVVHFSPFGAWQETSSMNVDSDGNIYTLMRDPGGTQMSANGISQFFLEYQYNLVKLDNDGFVVWQKEVEQILGHKKLYIDDEDNVYVKRRGSLKKYDASGHVEEFVFSNTDKDIDALQIDDAGNFYISSGWGLSATQNSNINTIQKYDSQGSLIWEHDTKHIQDIKLSKDNNSLFVISEGHIRKFQASNYLEEWSHNGSFGYGNSFLDVDEASNVYVAFQEKGEYTEGNVTTDITSTIIRKYDKFGNLIFEDRIEEEKTNFLIRGMNVRDGHIYLAVHSFDVFKKNSAYGNPVSGGSFITKLDAATGTEVWRQFPESVERQFSVYVLSDNDEGNLWTGFGFHLTWRAAEEYYVKSTFGDFTHEQSFRPTGGWKFNLASLKP